MESAALLLLSTALLRVALTPLAHTFWRRVMSSPSPCGRSTKPTAAYGSAQHDARGGKLRQGIGMWQTTGDGNRRGTRCGLVNFALDGRQKRTRSLFGPLLETSSKRTS
jgi:hypothetical protein